MKKFVSSFKKIIFTDSDIGRRNAAVTEPYRKNCLIKILEFLKKLDKKILPAPKDFFDKYL